MMKKFFPIIFFATLIFTSCDDNGVSFGDVAYYPSFLWVDSKTTPAKKTIDFEFSPDAKNDKKSYAEFQFVDNEGKPMDTEVMQIYIDNVQAEKNSFKIYSNVESKEVSIIFTPQAESGKYQGYLKLIDHNLDRLDAQPLEKGQTVDIIQWTLHYDKQMNPLAKILMWTAIIIIACLCLWFIVLRPILYPHFGKFTKSILIEKDGVIVGQMNYKFKGVRKVVFYNQKIKQSLIEKIFIGEVRTLVNPYFTNKLTFSPRRRSAVAYGTGYVISPNPIPQSSVASINNFETKLKITLR